MELRWLRRLGPPIGALGAVALFVSASHGATVGIPPPAACSESPGDATAAALAPQPAALARLAGESWFRLEPRLDAGLGLASQELEIGSLGIGSRRLDLPPESFAAGPFGRLVVVGTDDGVRSVLQAFDGANPCGWELGTEPDVIRRATIDPRGENAYEFRVDRGSRADLGVWRRPLAGGAPERVVPALPVDDRYGPTFSTELSWSHDGPVLAIQSCGLSACRTRLLDSASGATRTIVQGDQGQLLGITGGRLIAYGACRGLPCPVRAFDLASGEVVTLAEGASLARLVMTGDIPTLVYEAADGTRGLTAVDATTGAARGVATMPGGLRLVADGAGSPSGERAPDGWVLLSPDAGAAGTSAGTVLMHLADGATVPLQEAVR